MLELEDSRDLSFKNQSILVTNNRLQNLLSCVTYATYSVNSDCHFKGKWQLYLNLEDKVAAFKTKLSLWVWWVDIETDMFQILVNILKETEPGTFSPSWYMIMYLDFPKSLRITSQPQNILKLERKESVTDLWTSQAI